MIFGSKSGQQMNPIAAATAAISSNRIVLIPKSFVSATLPLKKHIENYDLHRHISSAILSIVIAGGSCNCQRETFLIHLIRNGLLL